MLIPNLVLCVFPEQDMAGRKANLGLFVSWLTFGDCIFRLPYSKGETQLLILET